VGLGGSLKRICGRTCTRLGRGMPGITRVTRYIRHILEWKVDIGPTTGTRPT
jgi:hypothetical protein